MCRVCILRRTRRSRFSVLSFIATRPNNSSNLPRRPARYFRKTIHIIRTHQVLAALRNNDVPSIDYGIEVLFGYSSPESLIVEQIESEGLSPSQYRNFLRSSEENTALFDHTSVVIDKADFSPDRLKAYFTARLITGMESSIENDVSVNFILSTTGMNDDDCWLIDSMLIRPSKLRRRRRR
jgi:hypothetical protein